MRKWKQLTGEQQTIRRFFGNERDLFSLLLVGLVALFANLVFLGSFFAACVRTFFALGDRFVATVVHVLLAFFAKLMFFMRLDAAFVVAFLSLGFCFYAAALAGEGGACSQHERNCNRKASECLC